jgi:cation transport protein ChaC
MAFLVSDRDSSDAAAYLLEREMVSNAYRPELKRLYLQSGDVVHGLTFVSKVGHPQYAPDLNARETVEIIRRSAGPRGKNSEYVINTVDHLNQLGITNTALHQIASAL